MAIIDNGIMGAMKGRIGPVTSYVRNGKNILRTRKNSGSVKNTTARLAQREKITVCNSFTRAFAGTGFFNATFPAYGHDGSGYNRVTGCLMNLAITGNYPGQFLSWQKVLIARGPLPCGENVTVELGPAGNCLFTWTDNSGTGTARTTDNVILCAFSIEGKQAVFSLDAGFRKSENAALNVASLGDGPIATWISFMNSNGDVADSVFAGILERV